jgi:hypothetical protein
LFAGPELLGFVYGGGRSDHQLHRGNDLSACEGGMERESKGEEEGRGRVRERRRERGRVGEEEERGVRG